MVNIDPILSLLLLNLSILMTLEKISQKRIVETVINYQSMRGNLRGMPLGAIIAKEARNLFIATNLQKQGHMFVLRTIFCKAFLYQIQLVIIIKN
jgi:hypothetical protein